MLPKGKQLLALALAVLLTAALATPATALSYDGSAAYESGKYYRALTQVALTGDAPTDIVNVALSQVGYQEGGASTQLSGEVYGGVNFTEYGYWYGAQDMWCAMFVSWCADVAGISTSVIPSHAYTPDGLAWFRNRGLAHSREDVASGKYVPQPGDLIYFCSSRNTNRTNHVGIVTGYSDGQIYTVEGNIGSSSVYSNGGMVSTMSYPVTNTYIVAVCSPAYTQGLERTASPLPSLCQAVRAAEGADYDHVSTAYGDSLCVGIGLWYGGRAMELLRSIYEADPAGFEKLDTAGIYEDLENADWSRYTPDGEKAECIRQLLSSDAGQKAQDDLLERQLSELLSEAKENAVTDYDAQLLYCLLSYVGGRPAAESLLTELQGDPTPEELLDALSQSRYRHLSTVAQMLW